MEEKTETARGSAPPFAPPDAALLGLADRHLLGNYRPARLVLEQGRVAGFRARLLETSGRTTKVALSAFLPVVSAQRIDFTAQPVLTLPISEGKVQLELAQRQWVEIEARF